ncbi:4-hydroxythreonine-4-phosphate dehydrogenase PdxA [bacterium]|nr:4-hydroxythreonine-4-phosphate dehydrogenase PdxA [bacterium]
MTDLINLGITQGDPAGIGLEIVCKSFLNYAPIHPSRITLFSSDQLIRDLSGEHWWADEFYRRYIQTGTVLIEEIDTPPHIQMGKVEARGSSSSYLAVSTAIDWALSGRLDAIVTAPINKAGWFIAGHPYPGHTDLLAQRSGISRYAMMLIAEPLLVTLVTVHIPLKDVPHAVTSENVLEKIQLTHEFLSYYKNKLYHKPIAVLALNPHGGEEDNIGNEEVVIDQAIKQANQNGIDVQGPFPADSFFTPVNLHKYSAVIAMYHDQGLIPLKMLGFERGVNVTLGLPFWRTSPDHGTAYDIAGKDQADPSSMIEAIDLALRLAQIKKEQPDE